ncbi:hypothetical protein PI126_g21141 [Phytophthora idaei]|nr:hypothetical protein PI126_g21141 [Phytophthora idaei]
MSHATTADRIVERCATSTPRRRSRGGVGSDALRPLRFLREEDAKCPLRAASTFARAQSREIVEGWTPSAAAIAERSPRLRSPFVLRSSKAMRTRWRSVSVRFVLRMVLDLAMVKRVGGWTEVG